MRKIFSILFALALALSFSLVAVVPAAADYDGFNNPDYYYAKITNAPSGTIYRQAGLSPDGTRIVAQKSWNDGTARTEIVLMNADGTGEAVITPGDSGTGDIYGYMNPFWSDDGTAIGFSVVHNANPNEIVRYDISSASLTYIYQPVAPLDATNADFLGSSKTSIVFWDVPGGSADLFTWDGSTLTNITNTANYKEYEPVSNADGTKIVYWSGETVAEPINTTHTLTYSGGTWTKDVGFTPIADSYWATWTTTAATQIALTVMSSKDVLIYDSTGALVTDLSGPGYSGGVIGGVQQWNFFGTGPAQGPNGQFVITSNAGRGATPGRDIIIAAPRTALYVDDAGSDSNPGTAAAPFATIQKAINESVAGGTVNVAAGTYDEQVVITKSLTIQGAGNTTIIRPSGPGTLTSLYTLGTQAGAFWNGMTLASIISVQNVGSPGVTVKDLKVDGVNVNTACGANYVVGISYGETAGTIDNVTVVNLNNVPIATRTYGMWLDAVSTTVSVQVKNSRISYYNKNAITARGEKLTVNIHHNTMDGPGTPGTQVPNGVVLAFGCGGTVSYNDISNHYYTAGTWLSCGIMGYEARDGIIMDHNNVHDTDVGIAPSSHSDIYGNQLHGCRWGIELESGAHDNNIYNNDIYNNSEYGIHLLGLGAGDGYYTGPGDEPGTGNKANYNDIHGNTLGGVQNWDSTQTFDALYNWWGDETGPSHDLNLGGKGDAVSDNVDFSPWLYKTEEQFVSGAPCYAGSVVLENEATAVGNSSYAAGWNSFSTPITLDDSADTVSELLALTAGSGLFIERAMRFNPASQLWVPVIMGNMVLENYQIKPGEGLFIQVRSGGSLPILVNTDPTGLSDRLLGVGLNLIGMSSLGAQTVTTALSGVSYARVQSPAPPNMWEWVVPPDLPVAEYLQLGEAYWVAMNVPGQHLFGLITTPVAVGMTWELNQ
jgi:parallel beta-helix repeat protein